MKTASRATVACGLFLAVCCGSPGSSTGEPAAFLRISNLSFSPVNLSVSPGATVIVVNDDSMPHSVTSEASVGAFAPGAVGGVSFDTGAFTGETYFVIPSTASDGTVIPYYCTVYKGLMNTPDGSITISAGASP